ncbi:hypothetical protein Gocc_1797 [Gaiella occulta]|uniref:Uncharacterized protein n=1 Tax=Gaiella occulta TaxID=1002870 RepID=A0A7M2YVQ9_9ACTN|nr:hypothetical protein Gocc_1797 [Gaiella occulta]
MADATTYPYERERPPLWLGATKSFASGSEETS